MAAITTAALATASAIAANAGTIGLLAQGVGMVGGMWAARRATEASKDAERARAEQMRVESMRRMRDQIRQSQVANATALSRSVGQGAGVFSSNLMGAYGQTQGALGRASNAEYQNLQIGERIFQANMDLADAKGWASTFEGMGKFGTSLATNAGQIGQLGQTWFGSNPDTRQSTAYPTAGGGSSGPYGWPSGSPQW